MDKIIATVIILIIVLGLIAFAILPQQQGVKDMGEKGIQEQNKLSQMIDDPSKITGSAAKQYFSQSGLKVKVGGTEYTVTSPLETNASAARDSIKESGLYKITKSFGTDGSLAGVDIALVDLSK